MEDLRTLNKVGMMAWVVFLYFKKKAGVFPWKEHSCLSYVPFWDVGLFHPSRVSEVTQDKI